MSNTIPVAIWREDNYVRVGNALCYTEDGWRRVASRDAEQDRRLVAIAKEVIKWCDANMPAPSYMGAMVTDDYGHTWVRTQGGYWMAISNGAPTSIKSWAELQNRCPLKKYNPHNPC